MSVCVCGGGRGNLFVCMCIRMRACMRACARACLSVSACVFNKAESRR